LNHLIIFIKNPRLGKVKTRIAVDVGDQKALEIYQELQEITLSNTVNVNAQCHLFYSDFIDQEDAWGSIDFTKHLQAGNDLGSRMANAFAVIFESDTEANAVIIGSDCPLCDGTLIDEAFESLKMFDVILGPSIDGGYYLLGMRQNTPSLFDNVAWSTDIVLDQTIEIIESLALECALLPILFDIDTIDDWNMWIQTSKTI
jgi:uncharacterized protein